MQTKLKNRLNISLPETLDHELRLLAVDYRLPISGIATEALRFSFANPVFLAKLESKRQ